MKEFNGQGQFQSAPLVPPPPPADNPEIQWVSEGWFVHFSLPKREKYSYLNLLFLK